MEVSIFDPAASVVYVNMTDTPSEAPVLVSALVPLKNGMSVNSCEREGDVEDNDGAWVSIRVVIKDPSFNGGDVPHYKAPVDSIEHSDYTVPDLNTEVFMANYAGVVIDVYALSKDGAEMVKTKSRRVDKSDSITVS